MSSAVLTHTYATVLISFAAFALLFVGVQNASAQSVTNLVGLQLGSSLKQEWVACDQSPDFFWGNKVYSPNITGSWSATGYKAPCLQNMIFWTQNFGGQTYFERFKLYLANKTIPAETDIRICIREITATGPETCTPWASSGSDDVWLNSGISGAGDDPDGLQIRVDSRPMPGRSILDMQVRGRAHDTYWPHGTFYGPWATTKWRSAGGGWTTETANSFPGAGPANSAEISVRFKLTPVVIPPAPDPTATLQAERNGSGTWVNNSLTIIAGDEVALRWTSTDASSCIGSGTNGVSGASFSTGNMASGTDATITEPLPGDTTTYTLVCQGGAGKTATSTLSVTAAAATTATLLRCNASTDPQACSAGSSGWQAGNMTIVPGEEVWLRWNSNNATSCGGSNFDTGNATSGTQNNVNEPPAGTSREYAVTCDDNDSTTPAVSSNLTITAGATLPSLTASPATVRVEDEFQLNWNLNGNTPAQCRIIGAGSTLESFGEITTQTGAMTVTAVGTATYTLDCAGGDDSVTVDVLPKIFES
jgi:hypothetical protein